MTPNEDSKWLILVLLGAILAIAYSLVRHLECQRVTSEKGSDSNPGSRFSLAAGLLILFLIGLGLGVTYAPNPLLAFVRWSFWLAASMTLCVVIWAARNNANFGRDLQASIALSAVVLSMWFLYGWVTDIRLVTANWPVRFSRIGHQNFTGDVLVMLVPLLFWIAWTPEAGPYQRLLRGGAIFALLVSAFMLMVGGMVGAIAGLGLGFIVALIPVLWSSRFRLEARRRLGAQPRWMGWVLLLLVVTIGGGFRDAWVDQARQSFAFSAWDISEINETNLTGPQPPFSQVWARLTPVFGRRVPMWASTGGMIADAPWQGFGTDSFIPIYPGYSDRYPMFRDPENFVNFIKTNPHNAYLQVAAENGLPMLGLFCGLLILLGLRLLRSHLHRPDLWSFVASWAFVAMVFDAGFNHVFYNPASLFMVAVTFGFAWVRAEPATGASPRVRPCGLWRYRLSVGLACGLVLLVASVPLRWVVAEYQVFSTNLAMALDKPSPQWVESAWRRVLRWFPDHPQAYLGLAKGQLEAGSYAAAEASLRDFLQGMPYSVPGLSWLAMAQARQGKIDEAIEAIRQAQLLEPDEKGFADSLNQLLTERRRQTGK